MNLLQNALKFTFKGYIKVDVSYDLLEQEMKVSVSDSGVGIPQNEKKSLFTMFGKLEATANINTSGIGLGLSICKKIVEMFDGMIYVDEKEDPGTKFTFVIKAESEVSIIRDINYLSGLP